MRKVSMILVLTMVLAIALMGCGTEKAAETVEAATGVYDIYNTTGEKVTELYLYKVGSEKGDNLVPNGFDAGYSMKLSYTGAADTTLVLEFKTESGYSAAFETLHIEEAPVSLLSVDAMTGATPIAFQAG